MKCDLQIKSGSLAFQQHKKKRNYVSPISYKIHTRLQIRFVCEIIICTRMHSSMMHTARLLPVSPSMHCSRGCTWSGGCTWPWGVYLALGCILNGSVRGRVSSLRKRFWTLPNLYSEVSALSDSQGYSSSEPV